MRALSWLLLGGLLLLAGCSDAPQKSPLVFDEFGETKVAQDSSLYFGVPVCSQDQPSTVTLTKVEAVRVTGTTRPIAFRMAWPDGPAFDRVTAGSRPVPAAYLPVEGASGELGTCGANRFRYAVLAVVFPPAEWEPISVHDLRVTYEVSGHTYTDNVDVTLTQCPVGSRLAGATGECRPGRAAS